MNLDQIESEALKLTAGERARLAEKLLSSLETLSDEEIERQWVEEAERRGRDPVDRDRPADQVLRDARSSLK